MPVLFVGHGTPMNALAENEFARSWREIGESIQKPAGILCISAHWESRGSYVTAGNRPATIHDFYGFPAELSDVQYPAPGHPDLARDIQRIVRKAHIQLDAERGLDHGCWAVLKHMFPRADIPVVELSMDYEKPPGWHYELAKDLAPLRSKNIFIVGSGNIVHNLPLADWHGGDNYQWAIEANEKMKTMISRNDHRGLIDYPRQGNQVRLAVPTPEHFIPLLYVLGLKEPEDSVTFHTDSIVMGSLSMTSVLLSGDTQP